MKKFIAVFDGYKISKSTLTDAQELAYTANDATWQGFFWINLFTAPKVWVRYLKNTKSRRRL